MVLQRSAVEHSGATEECGRSQWCCSRAQHNTARTSKDQHCTWRELPPAVFRRLPCGSHQALGLGMLQLGYALGGLVQGEGDSPFQALQAQGEGFPALRHCVQAPLQPLHHVRAMPGKNSRSRHAYEKSCPMGARPKLGKQEKGEE